MEEHHGGDDNSKSPFNKNGSFTTQIAAAIASQKPPEKDPPKSLLRSDALYHYILETSVLPKESEFLKEIRESTSKHQWKGMETPPDGGQFLSLLLKLMNAKNTIEIGVYTGYSLLVTALALPDDGKILGIDINRENYEKFGLPIIEKAGVAHKIDFRESPALPILDQLIEDKKQGTFDFIFIDADKDNYLNYYKRVIELVKIGGLIVFDNTLWFGSVVAPPDAPLPEFMAYFKGFVLELNKALAADPRIEISQVPVGDGMTLCRRIS